MSDWLFIAGPNDFRPPQIDWRQKVFTWGEDVFPQDVEGYLGTQKVCSLIGVDQGWPCLRFIPLDTRGWVGLMFSGPFLQAPEILATIVTFASAQPSWFLDCELNAYSEELTAKASDLAELASIVDSVLSASARQSFILWSSAHAQ